jgi:hypothetical protein
METLKTIIGEVYFYILDGVVFNVLSYSNGDTCVRKGVSAVTDADKEVLVPSFTVKKDRKTTTYYLSNLISDGDKYDGASFTKHPDAEIGGGENINTYYNTLCKEQIKNAIKGKPAADFDFFNGNKKLLGIPEFMISGAEGYTVTGVSQITFTKAEFDKAKKEVAQSEALKAADSKAREFGYKVTLEAEDITVEEISE